MVAFPLPMKIMFESMFLSSSDVSCTMVMECAFLLGSWNDCGATFLIGDAPMIFGVRMITYSLRLLID